MRVAYDLKAEYERLCAAFGGVPAAGWLTEQGRQVEHSRLGINWTRVTYAGPHPTLRGWHYVRHEDPGLIEPNPETALRACQPINRRR